MGVIDPETELGKLKERENGRAHQIKRCDSYREVSGAIDCVCMSDTDRCEWGRKL